MALEIKICGLSDPATMEAALSAGADYVGLVFFPKSPRNVSLDEAGRLAGQARGRSRVVALTVDADDALLAAISAEVRPDFIQAHGSETPERVREMTTATGAPVIKAVKLADADDLAAGMGYADVAAFRLYDAKPAAGLKNALPGGNGLSFDWRLLEGRSEAESYMLSGGLDAGNVAEAIRLTRAPAVDVSSGVESAPGIKDAKLIADFIQAARRASTGQD